MTVRAVEGKQPYTGGQAIEIDENKVISLRLRDENNLIIYDAGDNEIYVDLQLPDELTPTDAFPVGITTGRVIVDNGWDLQGTLICAKTTSGDNIKLLYADEGTLWIDNGTGTFKQIYFKADVDGIITTLTTYINGELAKKQNGVTSATAPTDPAEGDLWYDTTSNTLKVYNGSSWTSTGGGGGSGDVVVSTDTGNELSTGVALWFGTETDYSSISTPDTNTLYIQYKSDGGGGWQPGVNTIAYYPLNSTYTDTDQSGNGNNGTTTGTITYDSISAQFSSGNYITIPTIIPYGSNPYTISVWYNTSDSSLHQNVVYCQCRLNASNTASALFIYQGHIYFWGQGAAEDWEISSATINNNTWYNIIITYSGTQLGCYVNNISEGTKNRTISSTTPTDAWIGRGSPEICIGKASNLIIENRVWTAQEISDYYDQTKGDYGIS